MSALVTYLPWLLSALTILMTVLAGNRARSAWVVALVLNALWLIWIVASGNWGLLPSNLVLWVVYARNLWKWRTAA